MIVDCLTQCNRRDYTLSNVVGWEDASIDVDFCPKCGTPLGEVKPLTVEQLVERVGKPNDFNARELLTPQQLNEVMKYESIINGLLQLGQDYTGVKAILDNPAAFLPEKVS